MITMIIPFFTFLLNCLKIIKSNMSLFLILNVKKTCLVEALGNYEIRCLLERIVFINFNWLGNNLKSFQFRLILFLCPGMGLQTTEM